jgi:hypothetical protein
MWTDPEGRVVVVVEEVVVVGATVVVVVLVVVVVVVVVVGAQVKVSAWVPCPDAEMLVGQFA